MKFLENKILNALFYSVFSIPICLVFVFVFCCMFAAVLFPIGIILPFAMWIEADVTSPIKALLILLTFCAWALVLYLSLEKSHKLERLNVSIDKCLSIFVIEIILLAILGVAFSRVVY